MSTIGVEISGGGSRPFGRCLRISIDRLKRWLIDEETDNSNSSSSSVAELSSVAGTPSLPGTSAAVLRLAFPLRMATAAKGCSSQPRIEKERNKPTAVGNGEQSVETRYDALSHERRIPEPIVERFRRVR